MVFLSCPDRKSEEKHNIHMHSINTLKQRAHLGEVKDERTGGI